MVRQLHTRDAPALAALLEAAAPALRLRDPASQAEAWISKPSGGEHHLLGLWREGHLLGVTRLSLLNRLRNRHCADLALAGRPDEDLAPLLVATIRCVDDWSSLDRLEVELPADHDALPALRALGFEIEVHRRDRLLGGADDLVLGRLRPGFVPRPPGPPPPWPSRGHAPEANPTFRPLTEADTDDVTELSTAPNTVWGTLQAPTSNDLFYRRRSQSNTPEDIVLAVEVEGRVVGICGLHPTSEPDVRVLGMGLHPDWQGRGLGHRSMRELMRIAAERGARRVELSVWQDNSRARALYEAYGFVAEGTRRFDGIRAGGHASSLDMAVRVPPTSR